LIFKKYLYICNKLNNYIMNQEKAINVLIQGCLLAQSKGVFTLEDAVIVKEAIEHLVPKQEEVETTES